MKPPITNSHTHIFTSKYVPPFLAKTFIPKPFYLLFNLRILARIFKFFRKWKNKIKYNPYYKNLNFYFNENFKFLKPIFLIVGWIIRFQVIIIFLKLLSLFFSSDNILNNYLKTIFLWLENKYIIPRSISLWQIVVLFFLMLFFPSIRNMVIFILKGLNKIPKSLFGNLSIKLLKRYLNILIFANYKEQSRIFSKLRKQYPKGTRFVILPMDMDYMQAGKIEADINMQLYELAKIKSKYPETIFPFIFVDPRRIEKQNDFFNYHIEENKVILDECVLKDLLEEKKFSGIKIYPPLGYYPFDDRLLPLWKYVSDNNIPITTHSSKGPIFYRGKKRKEWNHHPVFMQYLGKGKSEKLLLDQRKNRNFTTNFTHPLNYLCILNEYLLRKIIKNSGEENKLLFGYTNDKTPLKYDLKNLKICFAHYGGDEEWTKFLESDRDDYSSQINLKPDYGIEFILNKYNKISLAKTEQIWKNVDWFSIITSLILQYPNVYGDISYILHSNDKTLPLLKYLLSNPKIANRILFGTDFYVVRNHKSDKQMLAELMAGLSEKEFDQIARYNPEVFLNINPV